MSTAQITHAGIFNKGPRNASLGQLRTRWDGALILDFGVRAKPLKARKKRGRESFATSPNTG